MLGRSGVRRALLESDFIAVVVSGQFQGTQSQGRVWQLRRRYRMRDLGLGRVVQAGLQPGLGAKRVVQGVL